ncbi:MAG: tetratricopeptide repeat protein [Bacteroidales bacterium]|nr:tetratricopeptide repeat protein [Bacteroidales bacterium]
MSKLLGILSVAGFCLLIATLTSCQDNSSGKKNDVADNQNVKQLSTLSVENPEEMEKALVNDSLNTEIRLRLAAHYYSAQDLNKALYHNLTVNRISPDNMAATFNLGNIYYDLNQNEPAIRFYEKFLTVEKTNCNVRCDLATCYMRLNKLDKAEKLLKENTSIDFNHPQSHYNLSMVLKQMGKTAEAEKEMKIYQDMSSKSN